MEKIIETLTVLFEDPFWVGICEHTCDGKYEVCKITFGVEPRDYEVYAFFLQNATKLRFSPSMKAEASTEKHISPKRMQRAIHQQIHAGGVGTKAQQALKLQQEQGRQAHVAQSRAQKEAQKELQFKLRQQKQKEKHKGH